MSKTTNFMVLGKGPIQGSEHKKKVLHKENVEVSKQSSVTVRLAADANDIESWDIASNSDLINFSYYRRPVDTFDITLCNYSNNNYSITLIYSIQE